MIERLGPSTFKNRFQRARVNAPARTGFQSPCLIFRGFRRIVLPIQRPLRARRMADVDPVGCRSNLMPSMAVTPSASRRFGHWLVGSGIRNSATRKDGGETDSRSQAAVRTNTDKRDTPISSSARIQHARLAAFRATLYGLRLSAIHHSSSVQARHRQPIGVPTLRVARAVLENNSVETRPISSVSRCQPRGQLATHVRERAAQSASCLRCWFPL